MGKGKSLNIMFLTVLTIFLMVDPAYAQKNSDKAAEKEKNRADERSETRNYTDRLLMELHNDRWLEYPDDIQLRDYSPGFSVFYTFDYRLVQEHISFAWGPGMSSINIHHNGVFVPDEDKEYLNLTALPDSVDYNKNKSASTYLDLMAELRFRTGWNTPMKLFVGAKAGALVNFHHKYKDDKEKVKRYDYRYALPYHFGLTARVAIGSVGVSAFYSLTPLLDGNESPELIPISAGIFFTL